MMTFKTPRRGAVAALFLLAATAALPLTSAAQDVKRGGTLVVATVGTPRHLNGAVQSGSFDGF